MRMSMMRFGSLVAGFGNTDNHNLYVGETFDLDLGLYYLRARWYRPTTGRFVTADKYEGEQTGGCRCVNSKAKRPHFASHHPFAYVNSDPVNLIDPSGYANMFETGVLIEVTLERTRRAATIAACSMVVLRIVNYYLWEAGDVDTGIPFFTGPLGPIPAIAAGRCVLGVLLP